jgi:hypothetical protein
MTKNLEYFLHLPYSFKIEWSDIDACYIATKEKSIFAQLRKKHYMLDKQAKISGESINTAIDHYFNSNITQA